MKLNKDQGIVASCEVAWHGENHALLVVLYYLETKQDVCICKIYGCFTVMAILCVKFICKDVILRARVVGL